MNKCDKEHDEERNLKQDQCYNAADFIDFQDHIFRANHEYLYIALIWGEIRWFDRQHWQDSVDYAKAIQTRPPRPYFGEESMLNMKERKYAKIEDQSPVIFAGHFETDINGKVIYLDSYSTQFQSIISGFTWSNRRANKLRSATMAQFLGLPFDGERMIERYSRNLQQIEYGDINMINEYAINMTLMMPFLLLACVVLMICMCLYGIFCGFWMNGFIKKYKNETMKKDIVFDTDYSEYVNES